MFEDKPHYRIVTIPVRSKAGSTRLELIEPYTLQAGCRLVHYEVVSIGGRNFARLIIDIEQALEPQIPEMPEGWDYREEIKMR